MRCDAVIVCLKVFILCSCRTASRFDQSMSQPAAAFAGFAIATLTGRHPFQVLGINYHNL